MDATDVQDITEAVAELYDQTCTISREGVVLGTFDCFILQGAASGGVNGANPDPYNAETTAIDVYQVYLPPESGPSLASGSRIVGSDGLDLAIVGHDVGTSFAGFYIADGSKQTMPTPAFMQVFRRWDAGTGAYVALPPQEVQTSLINLVNVPSPSNPGQRQEAEIIFVGPLDLDVAEGDAFTYEGGNGTITHVVRSDRTEARGKIRW